MAKFDLDSLGQWKTMERVYKQWLVSYLTLLLRRGMKVSRCRCNQPIWVKCEKCQLLIRSCIAVPTPVQHLACSGQPNCSPFLSRHWRSGVACVEDSPMGESWHQVSIDFFPWSFDWLSGGQGFDCGDPLCGASVPGGQEGGYCIYGGGNTWSAFASQFCDRNISLFRSISLVSHSLLAQVGYRHIQDNVDRGIGENDGMPKKQDDLFVRNDVPLLKERNDVPLLKEDPDTAGLDRKLELWLFPWWLKFCCIKSEALPSWKFPNFKFQSSGPCLKLKPMVHTVSQWVTH